MSKRDDRFMEKLRATFRVEAMEHLDSMSAALVALEKAHEPGAQLGHVEVIFRAAHSLKGAARAAGFESIESACQRLESLFYEWKRNGTPPSDNEIQVAHRGVAAISEFLGNAEARPLLEPQQEPSTALHPAKLEATASETTVRIPVAKLDARLTEAEEMLAAKMLTGRQAAALNYYAQRLGAWRKECADFESDVIELRRMGGENAELTISSRVARLLDLVELQRDRLQFAEAEALTMAHVAQQDHHLVGKLVDSLLKSSKSLLLLPFSTISTSFSRQAKDLCRDLGKEVDLIVRGDTVEMDKRVLDEMKDSLMHLVRNCADHGLEPPDERVRRRKPQRGTIAINVTALGGGKIEFRVEDDGRGVDLAKVRTAAVARRLLSADEAERLDDSAVLDFVFRSDLTTAEKTTRLSGRGLGLAIVREKAEKLGGHISVESEAGRGTCFRIIVPMLLATLRGVLVQSAGQLFVVPTVQLERVVRFPAADIQTVEGRETVALDERALALVHMDDVLGLPSPPATKEKMETVTALVLGVDGHRIAYAVDAVHEELEILLKPFRKPLVRVRHLAGVALLDSDKLAPVLDVADLLSSARTARRRQGLVLERKAETAKSILVAEDSITSRMLIKGMLESAGYEVATAVDGLEALTLLRSGDKYDLLVSDVEMPRLDGFGLTSSVRADKRLKELPVVLVTARETNEDRARGVDAGASAYIVKSRLDESDLLDTIRRLL